MGQSGSKAAAPPLDVRDESATAESKDIEKSPPFTADPSIVASVERQSNPPDELAKAHNFGRPALPPHSTSSQKSNDNDSEPNGKDSAATFYTDCSVQHKASLKCIEENYANKHQACADYFDEYKKCRREEHERKLQENARSTGGQRHGFW